MADNLKKEKLSEAKNVQPSKFTNLSQALKQNLQRRKNIQKISDKVDRKLCEVTK